jgi:hypothetical protein
VLDRAPAVELAEVEVHQLLDALQDAPLGACRRLPAPLSLLVLQAGVPLG